MTKKADEPRTSIKVPISVRDIANRKARESNMSTMKWIIKVIADA